METGESLWHYYKRTNKEIPKDLLPLGATSHFNVLKSVTCSSSLPFSRRDYYKICLVNTDMDFQTESNGVTRIQGPSILFCNTEVKYGVLKRYDRDTEYGYICLFNEAFLSADIKAPLNKIFSLFSHSSFPYLTLSPEDHSRLSTLFSMMVEEYTHIFEHKNEVLHSLLRLLLFESIRIFNRQCPKRAIQGGEDRLVRGFMNLLDCQFPIASPKTVVALKTAADFADKLNIHTNHLNHCLKAHFGKSTSSLIQERIVAEAIELLRYSNWSIADIGYSLGFAYPQHFSSFLKRNSGYPPRYYRDMQMQNI